MADEVTDAANQTQVANCFQSVDDNFICSEEFIGLYVVESIESDRIVHILKDTMIRMNLSIANCRGQCYDGAANIWLDKKWSGSTDIISGVQGYVYSLLHRRRKVIIPGRAQIYYFIKRAQIEIKYYTE